MQRIQVRKWYGFAKYLSSFPFRGDIMYHVQIESYKCQAGTQLQEEMLKTAKKKVKCTSKAELVVAAKGRCFQSNEEIEQIIYILLQESRLDLASNHISLSFKYFLSDKNGESYTSNYWSECCWTTVADLLYMTVVLNHSRHLSQKKKKKK